MLAHHDDLVWKAIALGETFHASGIIPGQHGRGSQRQGRGGTEVTMPASPPVIVAMDINARACTSSSGTEARAASQEAQHGLAHRRAPSRATCAGSIDDRP